MYSKHVAIWREKAQNCKSMQPLQCMFVLSLDCCLSNFNWTCADLRGTMFVDWMQRVGDPWTNEEDSFAGHFRQCPWFPRLLVKLVSHTRISERIPVVVEWSNSHEVTEKVLRICCASLSCIVNCKVPFIALSRRLEKLSPAKYFDTLNDHKIFSKNEVSNMVLQNVLVPQLFLQVQVI